VYNISLILLQLVFGDRQCRVPVGPRILSSPNHTHRL
jgi:hypothetical protein